MKDPYYEYEDYFYDFMNLDEELDLEREEEIEEMIEQAQTKKYIAVLEYKENRIRYMEHLLFFFIEDGSLIFFDNADEMVDWLKENISDVVLISLDYDVTDSLGAFGNGGMVVKHLLDIEPTCPVIIHTSDNNAGILMESWLKAHGWDVTRIDFSDKNALNQWQTKVVRVLRN